MGAFLLSHEPLVRAGGFLLVLAVMAVAEAASPRRRREIPRLLRWTNNLALVLLDTLIVRLAFPVLAVGVAAAAEAQGFGLFNRLAVPGWLAVVATIVLLDLVVYLQHVLFHAVPALWRLHRVHHADVEIDVTTGLRFHPLEILLSMALKLGAVAALGAPPVAVLLFEVILNGMAMFNHSNLELPERVDRVLRLLVVTPDMHRVHHSIARVETDSNYGFNLSLWDRLLGTYRPEPAAGHLAMTIGIEQFRERREAWLDRLLTQPFRDPARAPAARVPATGPRSAPATEPRAPGGS
jgi:sterol desaturase/sphingolipid hydroxylase (fatty acid hydroxylase superfamily)